MNKICRSVILIIRPESIDDFKEIARRAKKIDPSIAVVPIPERMHSSMIPKELLDLPMLVIFLVNPPGKEFDVAGKMAVKHMTKLEEYEHFKKHNIPCLPIEVFNWGITLDKSIYGDWVVLKPQTIQSTGKDVNMVPTDLIPKLTLDDFPEDHLIRQDSYYVQKFIKTGEKPAHYRPTIFLDVILCSSLISHHSKYPDQELDLAMLLKRTVASNERNHRDITLVIDDELNTFALNVAKTLPHQPLFGLDIIRDPISKAMYVLEGNTGGNVWHFSSDIFRLAGFGREFTKRMVLQYKAWDRAAEALVRKTHELAK